MLGAPSAAVVVVQEGGGFIPDAAYVQAVAEDEQKLYRGWIVSVALQFKYLIRPDGGVAERLQPGKAGLSPVGEPLPTYLRVVIVVGADQIGLGWWFEVLVDASDVVEIFRCLPASSRRDDQDRDAEGFDERYEPGVATGESASVAVRSLRKSALSPAVGSGGRSMGTVLDSRCSGSAATPTHHLTDVIVRYLPDPDTGLSKATSALPMTATRPTSEHGEHCAASVEEIARRRSWLGGSSYRGPAGCRVRTSRP
jgi:hypothetical protein